MDTRIGLLSDMTQNEFDGTSFNSPSLVKTLSGLSLEQVTSPTTTEGYTVWGIVLHLIYWQYGLTCELGGDGGFDEFPYEKTDWPSMPGDTSVDAWNIVLEHQRTAHTSYIATLEGFAVARLADEIPAWKCSFLKAVSWMATHDLYHAAQIRNMGIK